MENRNLKSILEAKEKRFLYQRGLLDKYKSTIISFKLNIPGPDKRIDVSKVIFTIGIDHLKEILKREDIFIKSYVELDLSTGYEALLVVDRYPTFIKCLCMEVEEETPLGRIYDFDVIDKNGESVSRKSLGKGERKCFMCENLVWECSRNRTHSVPAMINHIRDLYNNYLKKYKGGKLTC
ncbi:citrate lyase holo-[acyl-carrier protein] synthase [Anaeromicrobium sediminis]|uniref:citrate lyase holo-[acyl-carrier protein] synthase n=1 Tax=Anaeromicrobium sediminis TaxID=1478221 RepID=A0A267MGP0_9FIRM|nr:citrate lyase holo-[acyl-carrier protein] synthase [Anaeromicrobium sediminis]PAB57960.1 citrate lyase holo-[acyl-carrier protein] synthase [Anaeromicrobium sediminis]